MIAFIWGLWVWQDQIVYKDDYIALMFSQPDIQLQHPLRRNIRKEGELNGNFPICHWNHFSSQLDIIGETWHSKDRE